MMTPQSMNRCVAHSLSSLPAPGKPASRHESALASQLCGVASVSQQYRPPTFNEGIESDGVFRFDLNTANGKPLGEVNKARHRVAFFEHLESNGNRINDFNRFSQVMEHGCDCDLINSKLTKGTEVALALFSLLPANQKDALTAKAQRFYQAKDEWAQQPESHQKKKAADKALEKFLNGICKKMALLEGSEKKAKLDEFCAWHLKQNVYPIIIAKLEGVLSEDCLQPLRADPTMVEGYLYKIQNDPNDKMICSRKEQFFKHNNIGDKGTIIYSLINALDHKAQLIAGLKEDSAAPNVQTSQPHARSSLPDSLPPEPAPNSAVRPPAVDPVNEAHASRGNIIINNNINIDNLLKPLADIAQALKEIRPLPGQVPPQGYLPPRSNSISAATLNLSGADATNEPENNDSLRATAAQTQPDTADLPTQAADEVDSRTPPRFMFVAPAKKASTLAFSLSSDEVSRPDNNIYHAVPINIPGNHLNAQGTAFVGLGGGADALMRYKDVPMVTLTQGGQNRDQSGKERYWRSDTNPVNKNRSSSANQQETGQ
ncbi:MAG: hypothetical protein RLY17_487 [Pseudomonadota bacterium]|jgi:hypothetical protein